MEETQYRRILAVNTAADLVGRTGELERLAALASGRLGTTAPGAPGVGVTELLKHTYDRLFSEQGPVIPFYFSLNFSGETSEQTARRFLHQFLLQTVAFRRGDESILNWFPDIWELAELAVPSDGHWIDRLVSKLAPSQPGLDDASFIRTCLSSPVRAAAAGAPVFVIIDNAHAAAHSEAAAAVLSEVSSILHGSGVPFVIAGHRRFPLPSFDGGRISVEPLPFSDTSAIVERQAARYAVPINDETRDLIANQLGPNLKFIGFLFQSAAESSARLDNFVNVQKVYTQEIFGGRIRRCFDAVIDDIATGEDVQASIVSLMDVAATLGTKQLSVESWLKRMAVTPAAFERILNLLNIHELVRVTSGRVEAMDGSPVLTDYVSSRFHLEVAGENRAVLFGRSVAAYLKRSPRLMAAYYRNLAAIGLREVLSQFALQQVPLALFDHGIYADIYKGLPDDEILAGLDREADLVALPQIVYTASAADLYKPIADISEKQRSAVALGFQEGRYSDDDEVVWVAAEIDSKLEVARDAAEFWCERLEMAALMCNFQKYRVWVVSPEGFTPEAVELLRQRGAYGSSRRQIEYLQHYISGRRDAEPQKADEYEVIVPMDDESELIAAHALEEIARRHNVSAKAINQIKTALLEASINASEHSLSPDRRIRQKFRVENDRITVTISNRGIRLLDRLPETASDDAQASARRGWGLKLIEKLMDEVKIEQTDDGTSISMIKYLHEVPA